MDFRSFLPRTDGTVTIRPLTYSDAEDFAAGTRDSDVQRFGHLPLSDYTPEIVRNQIDGDIAEGLHKGTLAVLAVADARGDSFLGSIVLFDISHDSAEVGFWTAPWSRGRGVAQRSLELASELAKGMGLDLLRARTDTENLASQRVLSKAGFVARDGTSTEQTPSGAVVTLQVFERRI